MGTAGKWTKLLCFRLILIFKLILFEGAHKPEMSVPPKAPDVTLQRILLQEKKVVLKKDYI